MDELIKSVTSEIRIRLIAPKEIYDKCNVADVENNEKLYTLRKLKF